MILTEEQRKKLVAALYKQDWDTLEEIAGCKCCCAEHTFGDCLARQWGGCRSGMTTGENPLIAR